MFCQQQTREISKKKSIIRCDIRTKFIGTPTRSKDETYNVHVPSQLPGEFEGCEDGVLARQRDERW